MSPTGTASPSCPPCERSTAPTARRPRGRPSQPSSNAGDPSTPPSSNSGARAGTRSCPSWPFLPRFAASCTPPTPSNRSTPSCDVSCVPRANSPTTTLCSRFSFLPCSEPSYAGSPPPLGNKLSLTSPSCLRTGCPPKGKLHRNSDTPEKTSSRAKAGDRDSKPRDRDPKPEDRDPEPEDRDPEPEDRDPSSRACD